MEGEEGIAEQRESEGEGEEKEEEDQRRGEGGLIRNLGGDCAHIGCRARWSSRARCSGGHAQGEEQEAASRGGKIEERRPVWSRESGRDSPI